MSSDLGLSDYQYYLGPAGGSGGLTFGASTNVDVLKISGLTDLVVRRDDRAIARHPGGIPGTVLAADKYVEMELIVRRGVQSEATWRALVDSVEFAFSVEEGQAQKELHWQWPNEAERFMRVIPTKRDSERSFMTETGHFAIRAQLLAPDPRWYVAAPNVLNNQTGTFSVSNNGKVRAYPILNIARTSLTRVRVTNNTTGVVFDVDNLVSSSTDVTGDMDKLIRGEAGLIVHFGASNNAYGKWVLPRTPFYLAVGSNSLTLNNGTNIDVTHYTTFM